MSDVVTFTGDKVVFNPDADEVSFDPACCPLTCAGLAANDLFVTFSGVTGCYCYHFTPDDSYLKGSVSGTGPDGGVFNSTHLIEFVSGCTWRNNVGHYAINSFDTDSGCGGSGTAIDSGTPIVTITFNEGTQVFTVSANTDSMVFPRSLFIGSTTPCGFTCNNGQTTCPDGSASYVSYNGSATISF